MKKIYPLLLFFAIISNPAIAQFTQQITTPVTIEKKQDSIVVEKTPQINMQFYSEAYQKYLNTLRFKERNKIKIKDTGFTFTQAGFDNWAGGGNNSLSAQLYLNILHTYTNQKSFNLATSLEGKVIMVQSDNKLRKSEDWFKLNIKPNWRINDHWNVTTDLKFDSQFASTFIPLTDSTSKLTRSFFAPGTLNVSGGITYSSKNKKLGIYLAPVSGNLIMVLNEELAQAGGVNGLEPGQKFKPSFGMVFNVNYGTKFAKNKLEYITKLETFWDYDSDPNIWWENKLNFNISNYFSLNFYILTKYFRKEMPPRIKEGGTNFFDYWQISQSLGFSFRLNYESKTPQKVESELVKPLKRRRR